MNALRKGLLPLLLIGAMFVQSCKEASTTGPGPTGGNTDLKASFAKKGSMYFFHLHHKSNTGATLKSDTNVYSITEDNLALGGRTNVRQLELTTEGVDNGTIAYLSYNADSSASIFFPGSALFGGLSSDPWIRLPISASGNQSVNLADTTLEFLGETMRMKIDLSSTFLSSETLSIGGQSYAAKKLKLTTTSTTTVQGVPQVDVSDTFMWWVPEIGFLAKTEETLLDDDDQEVLATETLARFTLVK